MKFNLLRNSTLISTNRQFAVLVVAILTAANTAMPHASSQTLQLRDSGVPAKTVDDSGEKLNEDPLASPPPPTVLSGTLTKQELETRVSVNKDGKSLTLYLVNKGKRALIFAGDQATVASGSGQKPETALSQNEVISPPKKVLILDDAINVGASLISNGAINTVNDMITEYQPDGTPFYGKDQNRRKVAERRFGQRTLFPGESTSGKLYLPDQVTLPSQLSIPVIVHPSGESVGNLVLPINAEQ